MRKFVLAIVMGAALVASAVASGGGKPGPSQGQAAAGTLVVNNTVSKAAAAKPGPEALTGSVGTVVRDNSRLSKPGVAAAGPASVVLGKTPSFAASPALRGYIVVNSGDLSNPNGTQSFGSVSCPTGKVAFGGGVFADSPSVFQNINSSYPVVSGSVATGWAGFVDNASGADSGFSVWAVCAKKPAVYAVVGSFSNSNPAGTQSSASVQCPINPATGKREKVFGGGGFGSSLTLDQNINTSIPVRSSKSWRIDMNNASGGSETFDVYALCGQKGGWAVTAGAAVSNPAGSQTFADVSCASGLTSVGGGEFSNSASTSVNLNATWPESNTAWGNYENNASGSNATVTPYVVCLF